MTEQVVLLDNFQILVVLLGIVEAEWLGMQIAWLELPTQTPILITGKILNFLDDWLLFVDSIWWTEILTNYDLHTLSL